MRHAALAALALSLASAPALAGPPQPLFISLVDNIGNSLPGLPSFTDNDAVSTLLDGTVASVQFSLQGGDLDALHRTGPDTWLVSSLFDGNFNGTVFDDGDLVEINTATGTVTTIISNSVFISTSPDITGVSVLPNGNYLLSLLGTNNSITTNSGPLSFTDGDIIEYNPNTLEASIFLNETDLFDDGNGDVYGIHAFADGTLLLTTNVDEVISGLSVRDGDAFLYDPATDTATLVFSEDTFTSTNTHDIDALYFEGTLDTGGGNSCVGDFDNDGDVDLGDFGVFGAAFGSMAGDMNFEPAADFDEDGDVDLGDFGVFGAEFGRTDCLDG